MKYMEVPELASLSRSLQYTSAECTVHTRIEAYSCKSINKDKKLFASLEQSYHEDLAAATSRSPPLHSTGNSQDDITPFGPLSHHNARKTLYLLIATLNVAFPDHSFSALRPDSFIREPSGAHILNALSTTLISQRPRQNSVGVSPTRSYASYPPPPDPEPSMSPFFPSSVPTSSSPTNHFSHASGPNGDIMAGTHPTLYKILDNVIKLSECEVFSYTPDINSDPHAGDSDDDEAESDEDPGFSDDEFDDIPYNSEPENDLTFAFDEEEDELDSSTSSLRNRSKSRWIHDPIRTRTNSSDYSSLDSPVRLRSRRLSANRRPRTPLLWSSHWFFYNKKLRRILFISVWARKKSWPMFASGLQEGSSTKESFRGWVGDVGAGARALGLSLAKSL